MRAYCVLLLLATTAQAQPQQLQLTPETRAEARQHYQNGLRKFDVAKFDEAAAEFVTAYEMVGDPSILYNIAQSYRFAERHDKALLFYKAFARHLDAKSPLRPEVESRIAELTASIAEAKRASTAPPTGTIRSERLGPDAAKPPEPRHPPEPARPHEENRPGEVAEPTRPSVPATLAPFSEPAPPPARAPASAPSPSLKYAGIALAVVAVAGIAVGAGMSGAAAKDSQNLEQASQQRVAFGPHLQSSESNGQLYDKLSYVFYGVGGAAAVAAAVTLALGLRHPSTARAQLAPSVGSNGGGLVIAGVF